MGMLLLKTEGTSSLNSVYFKRKLESYAENVFLCFSFVLVFRTWMCWRFYQCLGVSQNEFQLSRVKTSLQVSSHGCVRTA